MDICSRDDVYSMGKGGGGGTRTLSRSHFTLFDGSAATCFCLERSRLASWCGARQGSSGATSVATSTITTITVTTRKRGRDEQRKDDGSIGMNLDGVGVGLDLPPGNGLVGTSTGVAAVELLRRVDVDGALRAVPHETGVGDVMLDETGAEEDDTGPIGANGQGVDPTNVLDDVDP